MEEVECTICKNKVLSRFSICERCFSLERELNSLIEESPKQAFLYLKDKIKGIKDIWEGN